MSSSSERAIESSEPHRSPLNRTGAGRTSRRGQLAPPPAPRSSAAPDAKHEAPIAACQPLRRGVTPHASRRWRRGGRTLPRDAVGTLRNATTPTANVRGRLGTARGPRGGSRRPGAQRWRAGVDGRPPRRSGPRCPLYSAGPEVSPVAPRDRPRLARTASKPKKKPPTAMILGNESPRRRKATGSPRGGEIRRAPLLHRPKFTLKEDRDCPSIWDGGNS